jgi:hypothetical protein
VIWDLEVDMVCTGSGAAGLATAISAVDFGGDVFVADSSCGDECDPGIALSARTGRLHPWLGCYTLDPATTDYFVAMSSDLGPLRRSAWEVDVPISVVHEPTVRSGRTVAPFIGARLREWAARCLASPYGFLHTQISDWRTTTLHTIDGETIEVAEIGSIAPDPGNVRRSVLDWLAAQARERCIEIRPNCSLQRIVFEEGEAVGAVFNTPDGTLAIRTRHGVTISTGSTLDTALPHQLSAAGDAALRVCLVSRYASRFGRVELLTSEPLAHDPASTCRPVNRQLHVNLHETRSHEPSWRCGCVDGHPSFGQ